MLSFWVRGFTVETLWRLAPRIKNVNARLSDNEATVVPAQHLQLGRSSMHLSYPGTPPALSGEAKSENKK
jgi:hypothetical protein